MTVLIRGVVNADLPRVLELWQMAAAEPTHTDDLDALLTLFKHDRGSILVAATVNWSGLSLLPGMVGEVRSTAW